jgi:hypothetical protein
VPLSARDRKAVLALLEPAQLVYGLTRLPRKSALGDPADVQLLRQRLAAMRAAASELSKEVRDRTKVPWLLLLDDRDSPDQLWVTAKKVTPKLIAELSPLVEGAPEAAFFSVPQQPRRNERARKAPKKRR